MSGDTEGTAYAIQMRASRWVVEQQLADDWSVDNQACLDAWLNKSSSHAVAYWRAKHAWSRTNRVAALRSPSVGSWSVKMRPQARNTMLRVAAVLGSLAVLGVSASVFFGTPKYVTYETPIGGRKILTLADGSRIELNTNTALRLSVDRNKREAVLDRGEAYFEIKHDPENPFVIDVQGRKIVDVGTKFVVRGEAGHLEISMMEGAVTLSAPRNSSDPPSELTAGDIAVATTTSTVINKPSPHVIADAASWRQGMLVFRQTTFADAVAEFNRYNDSQMVVVGESAGTLKIDGKFRTHDVKTFAEVAQDVLHLHVRKIGDKTVLSH